MAAAPAAQAAARTCLSMWSKQHKVAGVHQEARERFKAAGLTSTEGRRDRRRRTRGRRRRRRRGLLSGVADVVGYVTFIERL
eukprot:752301-Hanusia_phi.AAC.2